MKEQPRDFSPGPKKGESVVEIALDRLKPFQDHPFKVCEDPEMQELNGNRNIRDPQLSGTSV